MSLTSNETLNLAKKQYKYKTKAYMNAFVSMIFVQCIAIIFSFNGIESMGTGSDTIFVTVNIINGNAILFFTLIWAFVISLTLTKKAYRDIDFVFPSTRLTSHLSNIGLLITISVIGAISCLLGSAFVRLISFVIHSTSFTIESFLIGPLEFAMGILVSSLYLLLVCTVGYVFGLLVQWHKAMGFVIPAFLIGYHIQEVRSVGQVRFTVIQFFTSETSLLLFVIKVIVSVSILLFVIVKLTNRLEVKR
ncbi:hypothetical protein [Bacillus alkalicellulosilyticus]|uniref:hypothetical protein n=1 Tax=Alkalihalobacterium alkalicellulosilyticum TaxID=1912214 RepID=UPI000996EB5D|nr:hypothetical protein [Bacillus alkalicellulosilyticus]